MPGAQPPSNGHGHIFGWLKYILGTFGPPIVQSRCLNSDFLVRRYDTCCLYYLLMASDGVTPNGQLKDHEPEIFEA